MSLEKVQVLDIVLFKGLITLQEEASPDSVWVRLQMSDYIHSYIYNEQLFS